MMKALHIECSVFCCPGSHRGSPRRLPCLGYLQQDIICVAVHGIQEARVAQMVERSTSNDMLKSPVQVRPWATNKTFAFY